MCGIFSTLANTNIPGGKGPPTVRTTDEQDVRGLAYLTSPHPPSGRTGKQKQRFADPTPAAMDADGIQLEAPVQNQTAGSEAEAVAGRQLCEWEVFPVMF